MKVKPVALITKVTIFQDLKRKRKYPWHVMEKDSLYRTYNTIARRHADAHKEMYM
jgi:hypothetical protein